MQNDGRRLLLSPGVWKGPLAYRFLPSRVYNDRLMIRIRSFRTRAYFELAGLTGQGCLDGPKTNLGLILLLHRSSFEQAVVGDAEVSAIVLRVEQLGWTLKCRYLCPVIARPVNEEAAAVRGSIVLNRIESFYDIRDGHTPTVAFEIPFTNAMNTRLLALLVPQVFVSLFVWLIIPIDQNPMRMDLYWASSLPKLWACLEVVHLAWPLGFEWILRPHLNRVSYLDKMDRAWMPSRRFAWFRRAVLATLSSSTTLIALWIVLELVKLYISNLAEALDSLKQEYQWTVNLFGPLNPWAGFEEVCWTRYSSWDDRCLEFDNRLKEAFRRRTGLEEPSRRWY